MADKASRGPGKYDKECVDALVATEATCCVLVVIGGKDGSGFSVNSMQPGAEKMLPNLLRALADQIEGVN
jgi:hypothetical protein